MDEKKPHRARHLHQVHPASRQARPRVGPNISGTRRGLFYQGPDHRSRQAGHARQGEEGRLGLYYKPNIPIALIEAKDNNHSVGHGIQQGLDYAATLDIPFVFSVAKVDALMALCDRLEASLTATAATRRRLLDALLAEALAPTEVRELEAAE